MMLEWRIYILYDTYFAAWGGGEVGKSIRTKKYYYL